MRRLGVVLAVILALLLVGACADPFSMLWDSSQLDPECGRLPSAAEAARTLAQHEADIKAIENIYPGYIWVDLDTVTCPGRGQVIITYDTEANRKRIEELIGADTFLGLPYRFVNR